MNNERCRLCGKRGTKLTIAEPNIVTRIKVLFHIEIKYNRGLDLLSKSICTYCMSSVTSCWTFYLQVQKAQCELIKDLKSRREASLSDLTITVQDNKGFSVTTQDLVKLVQSQKALSNNLSGNDKVVVKLVRPEEPVTNDTNNCENKTVTSENDLVTPKVEPEGSGNPLSILSTEYDKAKNEVIKTEAFSFDYDTDDSDYLETKRNLPKRVKTEIEKAFDGILHKPLDPDETWAEYPWWCRTCKRRFDNRDLYVQHQCNKEYDTYDCVDCPRAIISYRNFIRHIKRFHWERFKTHLLCQCDVCNRWFASKKAQESHRTSKHPKAKPRDEPKIPAYLNLTCEPCCRTYSSRYALKQHNLTHTQDVTDFCNKCGKGFRNKQVLLYHTRRYHTSAEELFHCDICGKTCITKHFLRSHLTTHSSERPFTCQICEKTFKTKNLLNVHSIGHTTRRTHMCEICGNRYKSLNNLRSHHNIMHTIKKSYKCSFCAKAFKLRQRLLTHERQHTGMKPYKCHICSKKFTSLLYKTKHLKRTHKLSLQHRYINNETKKEHYKTDDHNYACKR